MTKLQETVDLFKIALDNTPPHQEDSVKLVLKFMEMFKDDIGPLYKDFVERSSTEVVGDRPPPI